jgi:adenylate cyclase
MTHREQLQPLFDWLVDGVPGMKSPTAILGRIGRDLRAVGIPVERIAVFVRSLHPHVAGRRFVWEPSMDEAAVANLLWSGLQGVELAKSPLKRVFETNTSYFAKLEGDAPLEFEALGDLRKAGMTEYAAFPLVFIGAATNTASFSTKQAGGFTAEQRDAIGWVMRPLARVAETLALMRTAVNLLDTYVGRNAGERILSGKIQLGDTESIRCVIWFSDLRGFTSMSSMKTPAETIAVLNELFECQVPAIEAQGGEVLKFIGDGMLAIFAIDGKRSEQDAAQAAAVASGAAFEALAKLNARRAEQGVPAIRFGLSLHVGEVAYGNIGGANRLDFTAIGAAVNLASRIEGLTGKLGKDVLVSEALAKLLRGPTRKVGEFELKGVGEKQTVFELA